MVPCTIANVVYIAMPKAILGKEETARLAESKNEILAACQQGGNNAELPSIFDV